MNKAMKRRCIVHAIENAISAAAMLGGIYFTCWIFARLFEMLGCA